jgi:hypothetical protein
MAPAMTLDARPATLHSSDGFYSLVRASRGRSPAEVARDISAQLPIRLADPLGRHTRLYTPDHSIMRAEWYFTEETADTVAGLASGNCLLIGTPTVASRLPGCTLVESSPWARERVDLARTILMTIDFEDYWTEERFDFVAFDPPWYFPALTNWINNAAYFSRPGAKVLFPFFGEGTRPSATIERNLITRECDKFGSLQILPEAVEYETPRFEVEALRAAGVIAESPWRRSDLAILDIQRIPDHLVSIRQPNLWVEIRIGERLVAVRKSLQVSDDIEPNSKTILLDVPGVSQRVMDTVSRRDPRWEYINVWFSNNRVARTRHPGVLLDALHDLSDNICSGPYAAELLSWIY